MGVASPLGSSTVLACPRCSTTKPLVQVCCRWRPCSATTLSHNIIALPTGAVELPGRLIRRLYGSVPRPQRRSRCYSGRDSSSQPSNEMNLPTVQTQAEVPKGPHENALSKEPSASQLQIGACPYPPVATPAAGRPPSASDGSKTWLYIVLAAIGVYFAICVHKSGIVQDARRLIQLLGSLSDEETRKWADEIQQRKKDGKKDDFAESLKELNQKMQAQGEREWEDVTPDFGLEKSRADSRSTEQIIQDSGLAGSGPPPQEAAKPGPAATTSSSSSSSPAEQQPPKRHRREWWESKKTVTVVGYRGPNGDVEYLWMDVSLEEHSEDNRFLAFEDKEDARTMLAALRHIAAARGIPTPQEDNATGHFHCPVTPKNLRMLEETVQKEVLVLRKGEVPLRLGMDEMQIRRAFIQAVMHRPRSSRAPRQWPKRTNHSDTATPTTNAAASAGVPSAGLAGGRQGDTGYGPQPPAVVIPDVVPPRSRNPSSGSEGGTAVVESPKQATVAEGWWQRLPQLWVIQLLYGNGAAGLFQCDVSVESEDLAIHIIAFEDREAAETVCVLSQRWTDLTSGVVSAEVTALPPRELVGIASDAESGVTVLKAHHLSNLTPSVGPDQLADMIMAARYD